MKHPLKIDSSPAWVDKVLENFDEFLIDHANNEKKASAVAMSMIAHYPDRTELLEQMADLALEELNHYRQVLKLMLKRGIKPIGDEKDLYVNAIIKRIRKGSEDYFLDRLLSGALIEARGAERFACLAEKLEEPELAKFYDSLARSERSHYVLFLELARTYFSESEVDQRWHEWVDIEAEVLLNLPVRARLH